MKSNPCFECICNPICRHKHWYETIKDCEIIHSVFIPSDLYPPDDRAKLKENLKSGKFFDIKFLVY